MYYLNATISKGPAFLWQTQIQPTKYGLYDMMRM